MEVAVAVEFVAAGARAIQAAAVAVFAFDCRHQQQEEKDWDGFACVAAAVLAADRDAV